MCVNSHITLSKVLKDEGTVTFYCPFYIQSRYKTWKTISIKLRTKCNIGCIRIINVRKNGFVIYESHLIELSFSRSRKSRPT
jgi:hypothetical protein